MDSFDLNLDINRLRSERSRLLSEVSELEEKKTRALEEINSQRVGKTEVSIETKNLSEEKSNIIALLDAEILQKQSALSAIVLSISSRTEKKKTDKEKNLTKLLEECQKLRDEESKLWESISYINSEQKRIDRELKKIDKSRKELKEEESRINAMSESLAEREKKMRIFENDMQILCKRKLNNPN